ncbi:hypothetical protein Q8F55_000230 [Vanrija albida]|uniref:DH domain-containing protein n=1 Tax=Vanrija albida TaxID=181172 RepID=A0ABR3QCP1_9TREE
MIATPPPPHAAQAAISSPPSFNNVAYAPAPLTSMSAPPLSHVGSPVEEGTPRFPTTERPDFPSVYSQESAPPSAPACSENVWSVGGAGGAPPALSQLQPPAVLNHGSQLTESPIEEDEPLTMLPKRDSLRDSLQWGQKRNSGQTRRGSAAVGSEESHVANMGHTSVDLHGKALPTLPAMSPQSAPRAKDGSIPRTPTTPSRPNADQPATRSPSMPQLPVPRTRARGNTESSPKYARSQTGPAHLRPGQSGHTRPKSMVFPFYPPSPATSSLSKRAHLIREIANTERAHATDLQLIQQAYVGSYIRPDSHHSIGTNGESSNSSGARVNSQHSQRSSSYGTPGSEDARRTSAAESGGHRTSSHERKSVHERRSGHERRISGHDLTKAFGGLMSPVFRGNNTPRERGNSDRSIEHTPITGSMASMDTLYPSGSSTAASSLSINTPAGSSPRTPTQSEAALLAKMGPPVGRPLQPADIKAVFLNLTQLAELSNELAEAFETAMGSEEDLVNGSGERGSDRLGEVFSKMLPRLRPLYTYYCARQSTASVRLTELMSDPATAAYLNDCWLRVKSRTHAWNLDSMLIKPVQRITKYPLLFDDLLSCTSPSHPDYHHIRVAAEQARALALEIDDAKRRKDVITSVIRKSPSIPSVNKDTKLPGPGGRLLALRRFKKDKSPSMSGSSTPGDSGGIPLDISPYAQSQLKELVNRLEEGEQNVRKVGKEMLEWASTTKILLTSEGEVNNDFWKLYSLSGAAPSERPQAKIEAYHNVQKEILATVWTEMNSEVCNSIMLMLGKLLDATKNPMTIIEKLNRKSSEYARYVAFKQAKKTVDRLLLNEASDYVAIHTQLLEELPAFLEGHQKIFEMAMSAFVMAQARFYEGIRDRVQLFAIQYLTMRPIDQATKQERRVSHARGIHRMFYNENSSADKALQRIGCVSGDLSGRPATVPEVLSPGVTSNTSEPPPLRHTPSSRSIKSRSRESSESSGTGRARSMSLVQRDDALSRSGSISAGNSSRLLRRPSQLAQRQDSTYSESSNRSSSGLSLTGAGNRSTASVPPLDRSRTHSRSDSRLTVLSTDSTEESIGRHSFGLPRIPLEGSGLVFDSFGFSPSKPSTPIYPRHDHSGQSSPTTANDPSLAALGLVNGSNSDVLTITMKHRSQPNQSSPLSTTTTSSASVMSNEPDASVSWQGSKTLYSCQAVADFSPSELGNKRFQGLLFLPLATGDLVNVYHEVGRVADLRDFPYTSVGVENDGAVVCCAENGAIGVAMCSFLEPLQA